MGDHGRVKPGLPPSMGSFERSIVNILEPGYNALLDNAFCDGYMRLATATHVFPPRALEAQMEALVPMVGMPIDVVKFFLSLVLSYPMGFLLRRLPFGAPRHLFNFIGGALMAQFCFGPGWAHLFSSSMVTYLVVRFGGSLAGSFNFNLQLGYMIVCHLNRLINHFGEFVLDFTGPQMVATIKLTSFGYNYTDGERGRTPEARAKAIASLQEELKGIGAKLANPADSKDDEKQLKSARRQKSLQLARTQLCLDEMPSLLEYLGFVYCFSGYVAGPAIEITQYLDTHNGVHEAARPTPSGLVPALKSFGVGILCLVVHLQVSARFPLVPDPTKGINQDRGIFSSDFLAMGALERYVYLMVAIVAVRTRYYFAWKCGEGAYNAAGMGYQGTKKDGSEDWSGCSNLDIIGMEFAQNVTQTSKAWNQKTQHWLENYTYKRVQGSRFWQQVVTYAVSAFWHGLEIGFYFFFLTCPFLDAAKNEMNAKIRPYFMQADGKTPKAIKVVYDWGGWFVNQSLTNTITLPFLVMQLASSIEILHRIYFIPHLVILGSLVVLKVLPTPGAKKKKAE